MKNLVYAALLVAFSFACGKKTPDEPKPASASNASSKIQLRMEESDATLSATGSASTDDEGSVFVKLSFRPGIMAPKVNYDSYVLKPIVHFPTYAEIGGASSGISGDCYSDLQQIHNDGLAAITKLSTSAAGGNADFSSYCDLVSDLKAGANSCPQASQLNTVASALCSALGSAKGRPGTTGTDCASCK